LDNPVTALTVLKLGGALLTEKGVRNTLRPAIVAQCAREIARVFHRGLLGPLVIVHGAGSFGHQQVIEQGLHRGGFAPEQRLPLSLLQNNVMRLRLSLAEEFTRAGVPVSITLPSSCMTTADGRPELALEAWGESLRHGMVPLGGGDIVMDRLGGIRVVSGDSLAVWLATHFGARRLYFATVVDGILERRQGRLQRCDTFQLGVDWVEDVHEVKDKDATGAMAGKVQALNSGRASIRAGMETRIFSMLEPGRLEGALDGRIDVGTRVLA
jgi:isopentenyl phosphate kinase